jgi:hypothetical protein
MQEGTVTTSCHKRVIDCLYKIIARAPVCKL